ncbi:Aa_trans-domain-containing protein [Fragilariopsis cylindrus CCMP1102]|uniref:Aa_trans-domain-containing protein n=1 Tax=Fragilariopsis cylindrus CCMP1102 TaxID=635003 RepID=A0A1E7F8F0_9STRA|nr:Aa_trans-domain-containing protein [Fragilariopsis cylindrus CCMP1102]|eukprot:OEU14426.1 Aa_trans-domain-containing protein [Fragilariopsis cylindrus CCMP1102]
MSVDGGTKKGSPPSSNKSVFSSWFSGGTFFDAVLMEASQQIGQSILTLPWIFANMGFSLAIILLILVSCAGMWTQNLLISLLVEYRKEKYFIAKRAALVNNMPAAVADNDDNAGPIWGTFSIFIVILALGGLSVAQIISTSSNLYLLNWGIDKRLLSCIVGAVVSLTCFIPTYREYRAFTFLGLIATTYTGWYMTITSLVEGPIPNVDYTGPTTLQSFFTCFSAMLFMFGTHAAGMEKADVMNKPSRYDVAYGWSILYVYTITLPNGIAGYYRFGSEAATQQNAFYLFDETVFRQISVVLMCLHEVVAFGLFAGPLFVMTEKVLKIDHKHYLLKVFVRYIIVGIMLLIAIALPFFGVMNSLVGAFSTSLATYIIPAVAYNKHYNTRDKFDSKAKNAPLNANYMTTKTINWSIAALIFIFGLCMGGWASAVTMVEQAESIGNGFFAKCYKC